MKFNGIDLFYYHENNDVTLFVLFTPNVNTPRLKMNLMYRIKDAVFKCYR